MMIEIPRLFLATCVLMGCARSDRSLEDPMFQDDIVAAHEPMEAEPLPDGDLEGRELQPPGQAQAIGLVVVDIDPGIVAACGTIRSNEAFFEFDSAKIQPEHEARLRKIADCLATGPLAGREVQIIGAADVRGEFRYNYELGGRRAESVADLLANNGVDRSRLRTASIGELPGSLSGSKDYEEQRRVVVRLVEMPAQPR